MEELPVSIDGFQSMQIKHLFDIVKSKYGFKGKDSELENRPS